MKLLEEKTGENLCNLVLGNCFADKTQKSMNHKKPKVINWTSSKVNVFLMKELPLHK